MSNILTFSGYSLNLGSGFVCGSDLYSPYCYVTVNPSQHGSISADPLEGDAGTVVTLSNTPDTHYHFNRYAYTGKATLSGNELTIRSDVSVEGIFDEDTKYNATLQTNGWGSIGADKTSGYEGDTVALSNTPSADCTFANYEITGATLTGNEFTFGTSNVTAKANFNRNVHSVTVQNDGHGTVTASPTTGYSGTTVTLSTTPASNYDFSGYTITGATLTGSQFKFGTGDVTAKAWFKESPAFSGFTYKTKGAVGLTVDPAGGVSKSLTATYVQISGGTWSGVYTSNPCGLSDCLGIYAPSAGTYTLNWNNWTAYSAQASISRQAPYTAGNMTQILSLDFWNKTNFTGFRTVISAEPITDLPQYAKNIHNGSQLITISGVFSGFTSITGKLIPFITAMQAACPNLSDYAKCLNGCTNASDYAQATAQYPGWF